MLDERISNSRDSYQVGQKFELNNSLSSPTLVSHCTLIEMRRSPLVMVTLEVENLLLHSGTNAYVDIDACGEHLCAVIYHAVTFQSVDSVHLL